MQVKKTLDERAVARIAGRASLEILDKCPDRLVVFPSSPCTNIGCEYSIKEPGYMNCTFIAAEAGGEHTLEMVGEMMGISHEGIRKIEVRAIFKLRQKLEEQEPDDENTPLSQPSYPSGPNRLNPIRSVLKHKDQSNIIRSDHDGKLGERSG